MKDKRILQYRRRFFREIEPADILRGQGVVIFWAEITGPQAQAILDYSPAGNYRKLKDKTVVEYAEAMVAGDWTPCTGAIINISADGTVTNGQHRLTAVTLCDIPLLTLVMIGGTEQDNSNQDRGMNRSLQDHLGHLGYASVNNLGALIRNVDKHEKDIAYGLTTSKRMTIAEADRILERHPMLPDWVSNSKGGFAQLAAPSLFHWVTYCGSVVACMTEEEAVYWRDTFCQGVAEGRPGPLGVLRDRLIKISNSKEKPSPHYLGALFLITWNNMLTGKMTKSVRWRNSGPTPQAYPKFLGAKSFRAIHEVDENEDPFYGDSDLE